jgi:FAD/FMN-containing dehydrogenase
VTLENFGRNVRFAPAAVLTPANENDVLAALERHRGRRIRAIGSLHSWSDAAVCEDVVLDLRQLDDVALGVAADGGVYADAGAGCTVNGILEYLRSHGRYTLPTCAIVGAQTIAGATATATHGAGRSSLSHYVRSVRVAGYDARDGRARLYDWTDGDQLRAARCGLGCTGILVAVRMHLESDYLVEERTRWFDRIEEVLDQEREHPLQQFYLIPWSWRWYAQLRRPRSYDSGAVPSGTARLHRMFRRVGVDVMLNGAVRLLAARPQRGAGLSRFYRNVFPLVARAGMHVTDQSSELLRMRHDLYVHVEMELFVPARYVVQAAAVVEWVLRSCSGESTPTPDALGADAAAQRAIDDLASLKGRYTHDYPITFRKVLADDTLISMTSGEMAEAWYAISLITYQSDRRPFLKMAALLAVAMASAFGARPHWGKICPLDAAHISALYPALPRFRAVCAAVDPDQAFVNGFARRTLGF